MEQILLNTLGLISKDWASVLMSFMQQGGQILWWLAAVVALCWLLVMERVLYLMTVFPKVDKQLRKQWLARTDHHSWYAQQIRAGWITQAQIELRQNLSTIKVLVAICPMLGLLGTVTGMISVFDVMATQGSSNPKLMASGISLATLPTMAGMVAALAGMFVHARLRKVCDRKAIQLERSLRSQK
ncbi:MotA/TolQ/ExbB proton channel family protein [Vibrio sp. CAU 1672]|uniref:MotA/TolQ/ExbB proton channel family protein n=1 Tax=Vibrio sp. CAU 1672 TaxID=3032594 RepID=UPI0023DAD3E5|nr:MotA/TolQ/ExbB proton channel family protein [Vibrio sp. CAU 1672]MDF2155784.1 MotA/TolQ/ExbB proton channel family protein [Vibrio sp. CAU 1672]